MITDFRAGLASFLEALPAGHTHLSRIDFAPDEPATTVAATYLAATRFLLRHPHPVLSIFWTSFLDWRSAAALPLIGTAAGFLGSVLSLGRKAKV